MSLHDGWNRVSDRAVWVEAPHTCPPEGRCPYTRCVNGTGAPYLARPEASGPEVTLWRREQTAVTHREPGGAGISAVVYVRWVPRANA